MVVFSLIVFCPQVVINGQEIQPDKPAFPRYNIGFGVGLDYGGFGGRFTILPSERIEFFGALGYNILGAGFNLGTDVRLLPKKRICPFAGAMFGYNAVIYIEGMKEYNKTYFGPSLTLGSEFWSLRNPNFFNIEFLLPLRSSNYHDDLNNIRNNPNIVLSNIPLPVAFSIGYHFSF